MEAAFQHAATGMAFLDAAGRITSANGSLARRLGCSPAEARGRELEGWVLPEGGPRTMAELLATWRGPSWQGEVRFGPNTASTGLVSVAELPGEGRYFLNVFDAVDLAAGSESGPSISEGDGRLQRLDVASLLAGAAAHEINNPLMGLMGFAQLLEDRVAGEAASYVASILEQAERIRVITSRLLDFSRRSDVRFRSAEPADLATRVASACAGAFARAQVPLSVSVDIHSRLNCVPEMVIEALGHLLENALAAVEPYSPESGRRRVQLLVTSGETGTRKTVRFTVKDFGKGIPEARQATLLEPFFSSRAAEGTTGVGLALARRIAQRHAGRLWFESVANEGSSFHLELPVDGPR